MGETIGPGPAGHILEPAGLLPLVLEHRKAAVVGGPPLWRPPSAHPAWFRDPARAPVRGDQQPAAAAAASDQGPQAPSAGRGP